MLKFVETSFAGLIYSTSVSILEKGAGFSPFVHVTSTPHHVLIIYIIVESTLIYFFNTSKIPQT